MNEMNNNQATGGAYDPYAQSAQPAYTQPVQPAYAAPEQPAYTQPVQPVQPQYAQPAQPAYAAPQQPAYAVPQQPVQAEPQQPVYAQPYNPYAQQGNQQPVYAQPYTAEALNDTATLVFGIVALALACSFYLAPGGIVFGILAKNKAAAFMQQNMNVGGTIKTGKILGTIGFIAGIVMSAILTIVFLAAL